MTKRRSQNAVSLFPFLAVLVCTMGALILLLLVTTRRIRQKQEEVAAVVLTSAAAAPLTNGVTAAAMAEAQQHLQSAQQQWKQAEQELLDTQKRHKSLTSERASLEHNLRSLQTVVQEQELLRRNRADELMSQQQDLSALQADCDSAEEALRNAVEAARSAEAELAAAEGKALNAEKLVAENFSALEMLRVQRRVNQQRMADGGTKKTLIEFSGPRGTARTPIVVEVDGGGFLFPTSGVRIRRKDLAGFSVNSNPLLAAVLTTHRYRSNDSVISRPYVLLLIRPDGILDFYPAQRVLGEARIHFGYELLSSNEQVAVADPVDGEAEAVRVAVLDALSRRNQHLAGTSDLQERIAALRAKEAIRRRQAAAARSARQNETFNDSTPDAGEAPVVRPFPHEMSRGAEERRTEIARSESASAGNSNGRWSQPESGFAEGSPLMQERRSIQRLLNPGLDIERSLAAAVEARRSAAGASGNRLPDRTNAPPGGNGSNEASIGQPTAPSPSSATVARTPPSQETTNTDQFWEAIEQQSRNGQSQLAGRDPSSGTAAQLSPNNSLPPIEGQPFQSIKTGDRLASSTTGHAVGGQPGTEGGGSGSQPAELNLTYYERVTVYLDPQCFTVAGDDPVPLHGAPISAILEALLHDLDKAVRKGPEIALVRCVPVVKFVVSPGAHALYLQVAEGLHDRGIPVSSVVSMESHVEEQSEEVGAALRSLDRNPENRRATRVPQPVSAYRELP